MEDIINFEELREGVAPNHEYAERIKEVTMDYELEGTYDMYANLQNASLGALLLGEKRLFIEIDLIDENSEPILKYLMVDETECTNSSIIMTLRNVLEFAPFNIAFKKIMAQDIAISQMTDVLNNQKSLYVVKQNFKEVVVDIFDVAKAMLEEETLVEEEVETGKYSEKTGLDGKAVKKREYVDHYTSCYNFSKDEIKDMMYN